MRTPPPREHVLKLSSEQKFPFKIPRSGIFLVYIIAGETSMNIGVVEKEKNGKKWNLCISSFKKLLPDLPRRHTHFWCHRKASNETYVLVFRWFFRPRVRRTRVLTEDNIQRMVDIYQEENAFTPTSAVHYTGRENRAYRRTKTRECDSLEGRGMRISQMLYLLTKLFSQVSISVNACGALWIRAMNLEMSWQIINRAEFA